MSTDTKTITAAELRPGHSIMSRNGHGSCSLTVSTVYRAGDFIMVGTRLGDHEYAAADELVIWED
jgi:hypothetical protein